MHIIAAKAVAFGEAARPEFSEYQRSVVENAQVLAQGLVDGGLRVVSGGTDTHLVLVDVTPMGVTGQEAEAALGRVNITVNKNAIPFDSRPPRVTSGLRLGTPSVSSRGFGPQEMRNIAGLIVRTLSHMKDTPTEKEVREDVEAMTSRFAVPGLGI
jgi:glycine hydroxymethyltransferase